MEYDKINADGLTAYDVLRIKGCPYSLPKARSMMQAAIDYHHLQDEVLKWYEENKANIRNGSLQKICSLCSNIEGGQYGICDACDRAELN